MKNSLKSPVGLNPGGIGPKIFRNTLPFLILAIVAGLFSPETCSFPFQYRNIIRIIGWAILALGIICYLMTIKKFLNEFSKGKLITDGIYGFSRNPLYASWILFILPSIALVADNWILLISSIAMYIFFKISIKEEEDKLSGIFGEEYLEYKRSVNLLMFWPSSNK
jgi:protein-S-isoprenylcysteine O-methyltransferase Ste14